MKGNNSAIVKAIGAATATALTFSSAVHVGVSAQGVKMGKDQLIIFKLRIPSKTSSQAHVEIIVPASVTRFKAPKWYGASPVFLKFISNVSADDALGHKLETSIHDNEISVIPVDKSFYTLHYTYNIPQTLSGQIVESLPVLNANYARFDNNLTFVEPVGMSTAKARLLVEAPPGWNFETSWGTGREIEASTVSKFISGTIVAGEFDYSTATVDGTKLRFAIFGAFDHDTIRKEFCRVLQAQQEIAGKLPSGYLLVSILPAAIKQCKGTSLTNALNVNIPLGEKLEPFNFAVIGTCSHELFHQWNLYYVAPRSEEGVYLFSEGFTNYFAVASLVRAGFIDATRFGKFMCRYRQLLTSNPKYPGADYAEIQAGLSKDDNLFDLCYTKGPFVALLLDLALREDTDGRQSLASWFRFICQKYGGKMAYTVDDLRNSIEEVSRKSDGNAVKTFDFAFLGGRALDLDGLFSQLGVNCDQECNCTLSKLSERDAARRAHVFRAE